jgi:UDP-glucose 4-epimerase
VKDMSSLNYAMKGVDYVFHAAALKQVPSCEFFPIEAVKTNVLGTHNCIISAKNNSVKKIVCLSTDKAAYPINAMGISKSMMEKVAIAESRNSESKTTICVTRYGNVLASRGSVIPLFLSQIKTNKPVTITDPNMTRFIMNLDEAVELVLYAFVNGNPGDIFVQKSPATSVMTLFLALNKILKTDSDYKIIGSRHGEKVYETLCTVEEMSKAIDEKNYFRIPCDARNLNYSKYFEEGKHTTKINEYNSDNTKQLDVTKTIEELKKSKEVIDEINK